MGGSLCCEKNGAAANRRADIRDIHVEKTAADVETMRIEYMTDVEGNWEYVLNFISRSKVLQWLRPSRGVWGPGKLSILPNGILVFGGDAVDKGPGDIRIVKTLLDLKRRFPDQVYIVLGNRDVNKLRFFAELAEGEESHPWRGSWEQKSKPFEQYLQEQNAEATQVEKLKWMLHCCMGCQDTTFETRLEELALLYGKNEDSDVVASYRDAVDPMGDDPWMLDFLRAGDIGVVLADTLFVHGGLQDDSLGFVPGTDERCTNVSEWVRQLNVWKERQLDEFEKQPLWYTEGGVRKRAALDLLEYGTPAGGNTTVIYYNPFVNGNPVLRSQKVCDFLKASKINRLISGHQPHGQSPTIVRHPSTGLLVITGDTSRSDLHPLRSFALRNPADSRGNAVSTVRLEGPWTYIEGDLCDGTYHHCRLNVDPEMDVLPDALVGRQLIDGAWIKTVIADPDDGSSTPRHHKGSHPSLYDPGLVVAAFGKGHTVSVHFFSEIEACLNLLEDYAKGTMFSVKLHELSMRQDWLMDRAASMEDCSSADENLRASANHVHRNTIEHFALDKAKFDEADTYIFDCHGTIPERNDPIFAAAIGKINEVISAGQRVIFISNDSRLSRADWAKKLQDDYKIKLASALSVDALKKSQLGMGSAESVAEKQMDQRDRFISSKWNPASGILSNEDILSLSLISSSATCAWFLKVAKVKKPFVISSASNSETDGLVEELRRKGITDLVQLKGNDVGQSSDRIAQFIKLNPGVDAIVVGWDWELSALKIAIAAQYVRMSEETRNGSLVSIPVISCARDAVGAMGMMPVDCIPPEIRNKTVKMLAVGNGTMAGAICSCVGAHKRPIDVGKPSQILMEHIKAPVAHGGLGVDFRKTVLIGDTLATDIELANRSGMKSVLVLSGVTSREDFEREEDHRRIPTWVVDNLTCI